MLRSPRLCIPWLHSWYCPKALSKEGCTGFVVLWRSNAQYKSYGFLSYFWFRKLLLLSFKEIKEGLAITFDMAMTVATAQGILPAI